MKARISLLLVVCFVFLLLPSGVGSSADKQDIIVLSSEQPARLSNTGYYSGPQKSFSTGWLDSYYMTDEDDDTYTFTALFQSKTTSTGVLSLSAYVNDTDSERTAAFNTVAYDYTTNYGTRVTITVNKALLRENYSLDTNTLTVKVSDGSTEYTYFEKEIVTPNPWTQGSGGPIGLSAGNPVLSYAYQAGLLYGCTLYYILDSNSYTGGLELTFSSTAGGTVVKQVTLEPNSRYRLSFTYFISQAGTCQVTVAGGDASHSYNVRDYKLLAATNSTFSITKLSSSTASPSPTPTSTPTPTPTPTLKPTAVPPVGSIRGDANNSGSVDASDASHILRHVVRLVAESEINLAMSDVDNSGGVTAADASKILRWIVRLELTL